MKPDKDFDCVEMKHKIQAKIIRRTRGLSEEQKTQGMRDAIAKDPILGKLYAEKLASATPPPSVAKTSKPRKATG